MALTNFEVHIEELVLDGFPAADRHLIGRALESELARLIAADQNAPPAHSPKTIATLDAGSFNTRPGAKPEAIGRQVAGAVHRNLLGKARR